MPERYQDEIEEILKRSEVNAPADPAREPGRGAPRRAERQPESWRIPAARRQESAPRGEGRNRRTGRWPTITPGKLMLAGLVVFLIAALLRSAPMIWVGLGMLAVAYLLFFVKPASTGGYEKRWRGQPLEPRSASAWQRFTRWLRG